MPSKWPLNPSTGHIYTSQTEHASPESDEREGHGQLEAGNHEKALYILRVYIKDQYLKRIEHESVYEVFKPRLGPIDIEEDVHRVHSLDKNRLCGDDEFKGPNGFRGIVSCGNKLVPIYVFPWMLQDQSISVAERQTSSSLFQHLFDYIEDGANSTELNLDVDRDEFLAKVIAPAFASDKSPFKEQKIPDNYYVKTAAIAEADPLDGEEIGMEDMDVILVSTGLDEGLSSPIHLEGAIPVLGYGKASYITTNLATALETVVELEERERTRSATLTVPLPPTVALHGHNPHRYLTNLTNLPYSFTKAIGWKHGPVTGPSSTWINFEKYRYPKDMEEKSAHAIEKYQETSAEAKYREWLAGQRWLNHCQAWTLWYAGVVVIF
ncbi:hypothetical protein V8F20_005586 [Naviculisporaceae sp. PSN 640]